MLTMAQMKHHFLRSRYIECLQSLENVSCKQHSIDAWNKQSNIIACNLMIDGGGKSDDHQLRYLIQLIQGLPVTTKHFHTESTLVYNLAWRELYHKAAQEFVAHDLLVNIHNSVHRVCRPTVFNIKVSNDKDRTEDTIYKENMDTDCNPSVFKPADYCDAERCLQELLTMLCADHPTLETDQLLHVGMLCTMLCIVLLLSKKNKLVLTLSELLLKLLNKIEDHEETTDTYAGIECLALPLFGLSACNLVNITQSLYILQGLAHYSLQQYEETLQILDKINHKNLKHATHYLSAITLNQLNFHKDSLHKFSTLLSDATCVISKSTLHNHIGQCFLKLDKIQSAIEHFRQAYEHDPSHHISLYNIAVSYESIDLAKSSMECFNLLVNTVNKTNTHTESESYLLSAETFVKYSVCNTPVITHCQAVYVLASKCATHKHFGVSADNYIKLLRMLQTTTMISNTITVIQIPFILTIYHEAAEALLNACRYTDCVVVCDQALDCFLDEREGKEWWESIDVDVVAMKIKAFALMEMGETEEAFIIIKSGINKVENFLKEMSQMTSNHDQDIDAIQDILCSLYVKTCDILTCDKKFQKALHFSRLAVQLRQDTTTVKQHCDLLMKCGNEQNAAMMWLKFRKIDVNLDRLTLENYINSNIQDLSEMDTTMLKLCCV